MNIWKCRNWENHINIDKNEIRSGLQLRFQKGVDSELKRACIEFAKWLRSEYIFPVRVPIYFKVSKYVKALDGELVSAKIFLPYDINIEPYITAATGDVKELIEEIGNDNALASILGTIAHELTHYFQWINGIVIDINEDKIERQAIYYGKRIVRLYSQTREHP